MSDIEDPELEDVRGWYIDGRRVHNPFAGNATLVAPFDRWLAAHDEQVRAAERDRIATAAHETCRECRDKLLHGSALPLADFILWGKYFDKDAFGPKCTDHARKWFDIARAGQYAVFDLRPLRAATQAEQKESN